MTKESREAAMRLPEIAPGDVTGGLDWSSADHAIAVVNGRGQEVVRRSVEHSADGLIELIKVLSGAGCHEVAIERPDGVVVEALLAAGFTVVVISPNQVKNLRGRYGSAGNKDDRFDAFVLADTLRTDRSRLRSLIPDTPATQTLRRASRARKDLVAHRVGLANQLRAHLQAVYPAPVGLFSALDSQTSLAFLTRFPSQSKSDWLSVKRLAAWLKSVSYSGHVDPEILYARLVAAPRGTTGDQEDPIAAITLALVAGLQALATQIKVLTTQIEDQLAVHIDAHIFTSLPRSGQVRAARLLAEIGDCRARFPTPEALTCLAGVAPSTRQSGKFRAVGFRWACDKQLRDAVCDFAADTRKSNPWAADMYDRAIARGHDHPHAVRILGRAWLTIIWRCWQDNTTYDPTKHGALQRLLNTLEPPKTQEGLT